MMVGWQSKAKLCLFRCPDKLSGYTHLPSLYLILHSAVLVGAFSVENAKKTLFIIHAPLAFFRTEPILKRAGIFAKVLKTQLLSVSFYKPLSFLWLSTCINTVCSRWECQCCGFVLPFHCKAQNDTSNRGMKLTAAAKKIIQVWHLLITGIYLGGNTKGWYY